MRYLIKNLIVILSLFSIIYLPSSIVKAEIPKLINYQARLTDKSGQPLEGVKAITFRIYDAEAGGNLLWEEIQNINMQSGIFNVMLGGVTNLNLAFDKPYFLEIKVESEVMSPRQRIASVGYAMRAEYADQGVPKGVIVMWSGKISEIPSGWALCNGSNGTPDLRDKFIVGARQDEDGTAKTNVTGSLTQSGEGQIPNHTHGTGSLTAISAGDHTHNLQRIVIGSDCARPVLQTTDQSSTQFETYTNYSNVRTSITGAHSHTLSGSTGATGVGIKNVAVYYALAFIMKL